jgi:hypothetical protein
MKGVLPWLVRWARAGTRDVYPSLAALVQNYFFLAVTVSMYMSPSFMYSIFVFSY